MFLPTCVLSCDISGGFFADEFMIDSLTRVTIVHNEERAKL